MMRSKAQKEAAGRLNQRHGFGDWLDGARREMAEDKFGWLFLAVFIAILLFMTVYYWRHFYQLVNDDIAGEHLYSKKTWDTGNPFFPGYANDLEMLFSRPWPIFLAAYALVKNVPLATKIELIITMWILTGAAVFFFRKLNWHWSVVFLATSVFWGLLNDYANGVKHFLIPLNAYTDFCIGIFLTFGMLMDVTGNREKRGRTLKLLLLYGVAFYFGLCGVRMIMNLYFPLAAVMVLEWIFGALKDHEMSLVQKDKLFHSILLLIVNIAAIGINIAVIVPYMHSQRYSVTLVSPGEIWEKIKTTVLYVFGALDIAFSGESLMSLRSILTLCKIALLGVLVWAGLYLRKTDTYKEREKEALIYLLLTVGLMMFIFTFTGDSGWPFRYYTVPMAVALMVGISYNFLRPRANLKILCSGFCLFVLAVMCLTMKQTYPARPSPSEAPSALMQLTQHLEDTGRSRIAGHYWNINTPIFFGNDGITGMTLTGYDTLQPYDWLTDRTSYVNDDEPVTLILTEEQKTAWEQSDKCAYLLSIADGTDTVAGYYLYDYDENPFAFDLYKALDYGLDIRYNFLQLAYTEGAALDDGIIVLYPGETQFGPYKTMKAGFYDVTVRGEGLENGTFDVIGGGIAYEMEDMEIRPDRVTYTVHFDNDVSGVEFRCINDSAETVKIKDITLTPWDMKAIWE